MKLYVIGNGFDRAHDLPTSYWDFRKYLDSFYPEFLQQLEEHHFLYPGASDKMRKDTLWSEFELKLANIDENMITEPIQHIDLGLEDGSEIGIEDTLYYHFSNDTEYISSLSKYLKQWVRTIKIRDCKAKSSLLLPTDYYITFNYTAILERTYKIPENHITHIHGSLREKDGNPVIGHGNIDCIRLANEKLEEAQNLFDERSTSMYRILKEYYEKTLKHTERYILKLSSIRELSPTEIAVIGLSIADVDKPYIREIDNLTGNQVTWIGYYRGNPDKIRSELQKCDIPSNRIRMVSSAELFDLNE